MLRTRRRAVGRDAKSVFEALAVSRNHLSAIENARALPTEKMLGQLAEVLDYDAEDADHLVDLLHVARQHGWWEDYSRYASPEVLDLCGVEYGADGARVYDPLIVTGLLQTEEYARAIHEANPDNSKRRVDRMVRLRMQRQERLEPPDALRLSILQGETALHQEVGGREVLRSQLAHIATLIETHESILDFRVKPFSSTPVGFATASTVVLMDFSEGHLGTMAWMESPVSLSLTDDNDVVEAMELNFNLALESSLDHDASLDLVRRRISEL